MTESNPPPTADAKPATPSAHEPKYVLPTLRVKFESQLSILRGFAAASGKDRKAVQNVEVAKICDVNPSTVSSCNAFFADIKLIEPSGRGYMPAGVVFDFLRANEWSPETSAQKLASCFRDTWFWEALGPRLSFRQLSDEDAVQALAEAAEAGPDCRGQLLMILDYCAAAGLIARDNGKIKVSAAPMGDHKEVKPTPEVSPPAVQVAPVVAPANCMSLSMNIVVPMDKVSRLGPDHVKTFFDQWANLINAKAAIEKALDGTDAK